MIRLTNSATRRKEDFRPLDPANVRMYVCGPTVYDRAHLGNARPAVVFDVLYRLLRHTYGEGAVTYVRNITDVDDKINARAAGTGRPIRDITEETVGWYHEDMDALGCLRPSHEPRATEWVPQMVAMAEALIAQGHAYVAEGHVLFRVRSYAGYGALSGRSVDDMIAGARVEVAPFKEDPMDFVLWKPSPEGVPGWDSPWSHGRPGWHIECSAMAKALLGDRFDIHGGGLDLQFPHHENEIAQSVCAHGGHGPGDMAQVWLHNEMLLVEGKKMSKSLGNFFTVRELLERGWPGEVIRFVLLSTHYRSPMDWTEEKARQAADEINYWSNILSVDPEVLDDFLDSAGIDERVVAALADDLNTALALSRLRAMARRIDNSADFVALSEESQFDERRVFLVSVEALGIPLCELSKRRRNMGLLLAKQQVALEELRQTALQTLDFTAIDALKAKLLGAGVDVRMSKLGVELEPRANFDPAKLESLQ